MMPWVREAHTTGACLITELLPLSQAEIRGSGAISNFGPLHSLWRIPSPRAYPAPQSHCGASLAM